MLGSTPMRYRPNPALISKEYDLALMRIESDASGNPVKSSFVFPALRSVIPKDKAS